MLEAHLRKRLQERDLLLMTHIVMGYPSFDACRRIVGAMVEAGVDLMELQIPFSEPIADGPVILRANQRALESEASVARCLRFAEDVAAEFEIPFVVMSYFNILYRYGLPEFAAALASAGIHGAIVPDLPTEEAGAYLSAMGDAGLDPIFIYSPNTPESRMREIDRHAGGFVYCVARKGVTGTRTDFSKELANYLARCRAATSLPLALGFGVQERKDIDALRGKADIAVVGTQTIRVVEEHGVDAVGDFIASLHV